ncbi:hypothetical protein [Bacillus sp. J33]|uniref:hypothetical protein n=1 Tax=Bacillus sp. J33 TaxID=935836 RepID=UPI0004B7BA2D|nr:hypothetical protein [Bacillus sp. J33]
MTNLEIGNLFLKTSLYSEFDFPSNYQHLFRTIFIDNEHLQFDAFCIHCQKESTFKFSNKYINNAYQTYQAAVVSNNVERYWNKLKAPIQITFDCQRNKAHNYSIAFTLHKNKITKSGQYPSLASIEQHDIKKYQKVLERDYKDFSKGIGLASHGVGIGSFVYLRRIFENLIEEAHLIAKNNSFWNEELYSQARMNEKINLLKDYLPAILVQSKQLYGIISKGIHELEEQECLDMFPHIKLAIELILDEKLYELEKEKKVSEIKKFVQEKHMELQNK